MSRVVGGFADVVRGEMATRGRAGRDATPSAKELERQLRRERARNAGLEHGLSALHRRMTDLHAENAQLRAALGT